MAEKCPFCGKVVPGFLTESLDNGSPACDECIAKEEAIQLQRESEKEEK